MLIEPVDAGHCSQILGDLGKLFALAAFYSRALRSLDLADALHQLFIIAMNILF